MSLKLLEIERFGGIQDLIGRKNWLLKRWNLFSEHRSYITQILCSFPLNIKKSLAIFGAGACLDIDLLKLSTDYENIQLIDIDGEFLDYVPKLQTGIDYERINFIGGLDLSGIYDYLKQWELKPPDDNSIELAISKLERFQLNDTLGTFNVVCSNCMLSQVIMQIVGTLGEIHPKTLDLILQFRKRHLEILLEHTKPCGYVVLISDIVSSNTAPHLLNIEQENLVKIMDQLIETKNFFAGCNPYAIIEDIKKNEVSDIFLTSPWLWKMSNSKTQLVYCLIMKKSSRLM